LPLIDEPGFQTVSADHADIVPPTAIVCTSDNLLADTLLKVLAPTGGVVISVDCAELLWGALERWDGAPAWVLLDCDEPEALGASLQERWPQLPIACFTGFDPLSSVSPASFAGNERWGPAAVVEKPFDSAMLLR